MFFSFETKIWQLDQKKLRGAIRQLHHFKGQSSLHIVEFDICRTDQGIGTIDKPNYPIGGPKGVEGIVSFDKANYSTGGAEPPGRFSYFAGK